MALKRFILILILILCTNIVFSQISDREIISLPIYQPTEKGAEILNKVLDLKHSDLPIAYDGVFKIEQQKQSVKIYFDAALIWNVLSLDTWKRYKGCVVFRDKLFFLYSLKGEFCNHDDLFSMSKVSMYFVLGDIFIEQLNPTWIFHKEKEKYNFYGIEFSNGLIHKDVYLNEFKDVIN